MRNHVGAPSVYPQLVSNTTTAAHAHAHTRYTVTSPRRRMVTSVGRDFLASASCSFRLPCPTPAPLPPAPTSLAAPSFSLQASLPRVPPAVSSAHAPMNGQGHPIPPQTALLRPTAKSHCPRTAPLATPQPSVPPNLPPDSAAPNCHRQEGPGLCLSSAKVWQRIF